MAATALRERPVLSKAEVDKILDENIEAGFERLRGLPGHCLEALPWEEVKHLVQLNTEESLGTMGRHPSGTVVYRRFRRQMLSEYASVEEYVKIQILRFDWKLNEGALPNLGSSSYPVRSRCSLFIGTARRGAEDCDRWHLQTANAAVAAECEHQTATPLLQEPASEQSPKTAFLQDFPYNFADGILHSNIWSLTPLTVQEIHEVRKKLNTPARQIAKLAHQAQSSFDGPTGDREAYRGQRKYLLCQSSCTGLHSFGMLLMAYESLPNSHLDFMEKSAYISTNK